MANEWTPVELYGNANDGNPRRYTIATGTAVSRGQLLALLDDRTAGVVSGTTTAFAGVASMEKSATDGKTSISCWTDGIFNAVASGAILFGNNITGSILNKVTLSGAIYATQANNLWTGAGILGYALKTAADGDTINVRLRL